MRCDWVEAVEVGSGSDSFSDRPNIDSAFLSTHSVSPKSFPPQAPSEKESGISQHLNLSRASSVVVFGEAADSKSFPKGTTPVAKVPNRSFYIISDTPQPCSKESGPAPVKPSRLALARNSCVSF